MSLVLNVEILGEFKQLTAATKGAESSLAGLNKTATGISRKMTAAFAAIGLGFSLRTVIRELEDAGKAAAEDVKSQNLLALAMQNTGKATDAQVASAEKAIQSMQFTAGIADDQLRPAYQKLFIATKSVTESNRLLQIAMDASAATGKGLDVVSQAMAKSLAGTDTALFKLIPSLKGSKTPIEDMAKAFEGAAAAAANSDPYQRMSVIFQDMQEQIGMALLPVLEKFSTWLATPEGQKKMQQLIDLVKEVIGNFSDMANWVLENKDWLVPMIGAIGLLTQGWKLAKGAVEAYNFVAGIAAGLGAGVLGAVGVGAAILAIPGSSAVGAAKPSVPTIKPSIPAGTAPFKPGMAPSKSGGTVINNFINGSQSAQQIAATLNKQVKSSGSTSLSPSILRQLR